MIETVILPGKHGDIIQVLPALERISWQLGKPVRVLACQPYIQTLDGVSYVEPELMSGDWKKMIPEGLRRYPKAVAPQFWNNPAAEEYTRPCLTNTITVKRNGQSLLLDGKKFTDYGTAMWLKLGFTRDDMLESVPNFDRRDRDRESSLVRHYQINKKPTILLHLESESSGFGWLPEVVNRLNREFGKSVQFIDLCKVRASRIYDLLGLLDAAHGLIACDSAVFHLAAASTKPWIAFYKSQWSGSVPRGRVKLSLPYSRVPKALDLIAKTVAEMCGLAKP